jgi:hypothetical protein
MAVHLLGDVRKTDVKHGQYGRHKGFLKAENHDIKKAFYRISEGVVSIWRITEIMDKYRETKINLRKLGGKTVINISSYMSY